MSRQAVDPRLRSQRSPPMVRRSRALFYIPIDRAGAMNRRTTTIAVCLVDAAAWAFVAFAAFTSGSDAATRGLDQGAGLIVTGLFLVTGAPAIALTWMRRAPTAALVLALAFPVAFGVAFLAAVIAFA